MILEILKVLMEITQCRLTFTKEMEKNVKNAQILFRRTKSREGVPIGAVDAKNEKGPT